MALSPDEAAQRYNRGITAFGVDNYSKCGDKKGSGFLAVANCLHDAKKVSLTADSMTKKYRAAA